MPSIDQNVTFWKGNTTPIVINVVNSDGTVPDLTHASIYWWLGRNQYAEGSDVFVEKSYIDGVSDGIQLTVVQGQFVILPQHADTAHLPAGDWYHEAEVVLPDGSYATVTTGDFVLKGAIGALSS